MKRFIVFLLILAILGGTGFGVYWLFFRDKTDGGGLSNKEVVFALQNIIEDQGINLNTIIENCNKVDFAPASSMVVFAEEKTEVEDNFEDLLTKTTEFEYSNANFEKFSAVVVEAYKAMYNNVFNNLKFRQNVWYQCEDVKFKVCSDVDGKIEILAFKNGVYFEITFDYNFRNETNIYSYQTKILTEGENNNYEYLFFNRNAQRVLGFDNIKFASSQKYDGTEDEINFELNTVFATKFFAYDGEESEYKTFDELTDEQKNEITKYVFKDLNVNFKNFEIAKTANAEKLI